MSSKICGLVPKQQGIVVRHSALYVYHFIYKFSKSELKHWIQYFQSVSVGAGNSFTYHMHFLKQAHMVGVAYDSETNSLETGYFSIIFYMQAMNSKSWEKENVWAGKLYSSCQMSTLLVLLVQAKNNSSQTYGQRKVFCPDKEWWSLYSFLGLTWTSQLNVNQSLFYSFQTGDLILLVFDERYENYLVLSTGQTLFFLHPDSMTGLDIATSECSNKTIFVCYFQCLQLVQ